MNCPDKLQRVLLVILATETINVIPQMQTAYVFDAPPAYVIRINNQQTNIVMIRMAVYNNDLRFIKTVARITPLLQRILQ